jgi:5-methylcytosine-specific restriction endonuclease McrA
MEDEYPYQTYYSKIDEVMSRDNYICQICGYYGVQANDIVVRRCLESEKQGIPFQPRSDWIPPKPCRDKGLKYKVCGECPQFKEISIESVSQANLMVHHIDGNKKNQSLANLITVCRSCHRSLHPRGRVLTIDEVKQKTKRKKG